MKKLIIYFPCKTTLSRFKEQTKTNFRLSSFGATSLSGYFTRQEIQTALHRYGAFLIDETMPKAKEHSALL